MFRSLCESLSSNSRGAVIQVTNSLEQKEQWLLMPPSRAQVEEMTLMRVASREMMLLDGPGAQTSQHDALEEEQELLVSYVSSSLASLPMLTGYNPLMFSLQPKYEEAARAQTHTSAHPPQAHAHKRAHASEPVQQEVSKKSRNDPRGTSNKRSLELKKL